MIESTNDNFNLNQAGTKQIVEKPMVLKIVFIAAICIISIMGLTFSFVLFSAFGWIGAVISLVFFTGLGFLANFVFKKIFSQNFKLDFDIAKKVEYTGLLTKKWWVDEEVRKEGGHFGMEHVYYISLNDKTFKIGDSYHHGGAELYDSLEPNKMYTLTESAHIPGLLFSINEVKVESKQRSTNLGF